MQAASLRQYTVAAQGNPSLILRFLSRFLYLSEETNNSLRFALFLGTLPVPKNCALLGGKQGFRSGSAWIRIDLTCWIRIRIRIQIADPDPGGQK